MIMKRGVPHGRQKTEALENEMQSIKKTSKFL